MASQDLILPIDLVFCTHTEAQRCGGTFSNQEKFVWQGGLILVAPQGQIRKSQLQRHGLQLPVLQLPSWPHEFWMLELKPAGKRKSDAAHSIIRYRFVAQEGREPWLCQQDLFTVLPSSFLWVVCSVKRALGRVCTPEQLLPNRRLSGEEQRICSKEKGRNLALFALRRRNSALQGSHSRVGGGQLQNTDSCMLILEDNCSNSNENQWNFHKIAYNIALDNWMDHIKRDNYYRLSSRNTQETGKGVQGVRKGRCEDWEKQARKLSFGFRDDFLIF